MTEVTEATNPTTSNVAENPRVAVATMAPATAITAKTHFATFEAVAWFSLRALAPDRAAPSNKMPAPADRANTLTTISPIAPAAIAPVPSMNTTPFVQTDIIIHMALIIHIYYNTIKRTFLMKRLFLICITMCGCSHYYAKDQKIQSNQTFWPWEKGRIHYIERGEGPHHVVLLHGFGANTFTWKNQIDLLSQEGFHVWAIDFLGFGFSDKPSAMEYSVELYRQQVEDFLEAKGIQKTHVIANSMGGTVALALAENSPKKISSLVLIDPLAYPVKMPFFYSLGKMFGKWMIPFFSRNLVHQTMKKIYYDPEKITEDQIDAYWRPLQMEGGREVTISILHSFDLDTLQQLRPSYAKMKMPILLVWGEQDKWIPLSHLASLSADFPHAEQVTIPFCGHAPQEEKPDEVNPQITQFLKDRQIRKH
ncbi:MAG TPA: alpha/beta fold hydrolase [Chlamydiales bacterium]|nr:alpha/beta fold hydrolase [Chlamydiales bacterium]